PGVDGTLLEVTVQVPPGSGPHPLVAVLHGWGGSKGSDGYLADPLLADRNAVLRYSARGFGQSWGQVNLADVDVEIADLRSIIGQAVDEPCLRFNPASLGVFGCSCGWIPSWV